MKILVVDDDKDIVHLLKISLEKEGYSVGTAFSGKEALNKLGKENVDLMLLDVMMPEMSGWDVVEAVRKDQRTKVLPIMMLTVKKEFEDIEKGYRLGVNNYITKPFRKEVLIKSVNDALKSIGVREEEIRGLEEVGSAAYTAFFLRNPEAILLVSQDKRITAVNPALEALTGWKSEEIVGKMTCGELFDCHDAEGNKLLEAECLKALYSAERASHSEFCISTKYELSIPVSAHVFGLRTGGLSAVVLRNLSAEKERAVQEPMRV